MTATEQIDIKDLTRLCAALYIGNILAALSQFSVYISAFGMAAVLCITVYAYIKRAELKGTLFETHFHWMIRSFWIGGAVYLPILTVLGTAYFLSNADLTKMADAAWEGEKNRLYLMSLMYESNADLMNRMMLVSTAFFSAWWAWRMLRGLFFLRKQQPVASVNSWL